MRETIEGQRPWLVLQYLFGALRALPERRYDHELSSIRVEYRFRDASSRRSGYDGAHAQSGREHGAGDDEELDGAADAVGRS